MRLFRPLFRLALLLSLAASTLYAQPYIELGEAVKQKLVKAVVLGVGGYSGKSIEVRVQNLTQNEVNLRIEPGRIFENEDSSYQDLMLMEAIQFTLAPGKGKRAQLQGMCTESHNACPRQGQPYTLGEISNGPLKELAALAAAYQYHNSTVQCAVWTLANNNSIDDIYGEDTVMTHRVADIVSRAIGKPLKYFHLTSRPHAITNISTSLDCLIPATSSKTKLAVYDQEGNLVRTYFEGKELERGFRQFKFAMNHTKGPDYKLFIKLEIDGNVLYQRQLLATDSITELRKLNVQTSFSWEQKQQVEHGEVGLYDEKGNCYFVIEKDKTIKPGYARGTYVAGCYVPEGIPLFLQIRDANGKVLQSTEIGKDDTPPTEFAKETISGVYNFILDKRVEDAMLAIYNAKGERIRVMYDHSTFNPGEKKMSYSFSHFEGPNAKFFFKITDANGNVVKEDPVNP